MVLYAYGRTADAWWRQNEDKLARLDNLQVFRLAFDDTAALARLAERNMQLQCNVQEGQAWMGNGGRDATLTPERLHPSL